MTNEQSDSLINQVKEIQTAWDNYNTFFTPVNTEQPDLAAHWEAIARKSSHYSRGLELRMMKALDELRDLIDGDSPMGGPISDIIRTLEGRKS